MTPLPSAQVAPPFERIVTNWRRFSTGLWRVSEGDIAAAYSASTLPKVQVFTHECRLFTNGGSCFSKCAVHAEVHGYPLLPVDNYRGAESVPYSYQGRLVTYNGKAFRLGTKILFVASDPTVDEWRRLLRSLFADGGLFAAGCNYQDFLVNRFAPESENGRAAWFKEVAECGGGGMPRTKDEMVQFLDAEEKAIRSATHQLAFNL